MPRSGHKANQSAKRYFERAGLSVGAARTAMKQWTRYTGLVMIGLAACLGPGCGKKTGAKSADASSPPPLSEDRKSTRLNSSHVAISYAVFCLKKKKKKNN